MAEIPENNLFQFRSDSVGKIRAFRTVLFVFIALASYLCIDQLPLIEAITGSMATMIVSVICPALFYQRLVLDPTFDPTLSTKKVLKHQIVGSHRDQHINGASPIFLAHRKGRESGWKRLGMRIVLYLYVIIGTLFGLYMFSTDLINAITERG